MKAIESIKVSQSTILPVRRRGRPRRLRSMGRYPWIPWTRAYLEAVRPHYSPKTYSVMRRGLARIGKAFQELRDSGAVTTTNPKKMRLADIEAFIVWMGKCPAKNGIGLSPSTKESYLGYLVNLLRWVENPVLRDMRLPSYMRFPRKVPTEVPAFSETTVEEIRRRLETMPGWEGTVARFTVAVCAYSGLRRSELRLARLQDIDTENWRILVVHPKGEGIWATAGTAIILPPARKAILDFLSARKEYLKKHKIEECEALIPRVCSDGKVEYWTDGMWGAMKDEAQNWVEIPFRLQDLRASFAQMCKDRGASIEAVSRALRHRTVRTTELYYARMRPETAFKELEALF